MYLQYDYFDVKFRLPPGFWGMDIVEILKKPCILCRCKANNPKVDFILKRLTKHPIRIQLNILRPVLLWPLHAPTQNGARPIFHMWVLPIRYSVHAVSCEAITLLEGFFCWIEIFGSMIILTWSFGSRQVFEEWIS